MREEEATNHKYLKVTLPFEQEGLLGRGLNNMVMAFIQMTVLEQLFLILGEVQRFLSLKAELKNQRLRQQRRRHCLRQQERRVRRT